MVKPSNHNKSLTKQSIWVHFLLYPTHTLPTAIAPIAIAAGIASQLGTLHWPLIALVFLGSWFIHLGGVLADNYMLLKCYSNIPEHPELLEALRNGSLKLSALKRASIACFIVGCLPGPYLIAIGGPPVLFIGLIGVISSLCYAATPLRYARLGLADPIFFLMFGLIAVLGTVYILAAQQADPGTSWQTIWQSMPMIVWLAGLPAGAIITNVLIIDDMRDREFDQAKRWSTTAVRHGLIGSRVEFVFLGVLAYLVPICLWLCLDQSYWVMLPYLTLLEFIIICRRVLRYQSTADLLTMTPRTSRLAMIFSVLLGIGLACT